uniref:Formate-dependent phosphoribosylglycinamide formyltransferase n=1 Tax=Candidatus Methanogaster sp. ANME-2c ERB4 TaxID=2759911 RepID=A0A7G9Y6S7_9EURY|nr:formate-dependent phosphoribosylglycinamide formyltransferase [Methanosarcinales archaeon ANME-2c ERB4]QNO43891.1 formate-dependent phosphoribosylglycinamide formyltransferase [Methanosarcinales archaeon ANME-2c ERB4]
MKKLEILAAPLEERSLKLLLFGAGELGKEIAIEAQRLGMEVIAVDRYERAPAQQVAHKAYTANMMDANAMRSIVDRERPDIIIPEIEAIDLDILFEFEDDGYLVTPNAAATHAAMNRERIRDLIVASGVKTGAYAYTRTDDLPEFTDAVEKIGYPCFSKAIMSSSGKGSYFIESRDDIEAAMDAARYETRGSGERAIIEEYIPFDTEVTELAVRHMDEDGNIVTTFPKPVGHYQIDGDYHSSWQSPNIEEYLPYNVDDIGKSARKDPELAKEAERKIYDAARRITDELGGVGVFGCELFVRVRDGKVEVYGNECAPRPHDTGMVTYISHPQGFNEGGLHVRAITGLPVPARIEDGYRIFDPLMPAASHVIISQAKGFDPMYKGLFDAMSVPGTNIHLFGKPFSYHSGGVVEERMGIALAMGRDAFDAKKKAEVAAHKILIRTATDREWRGQEETRMHVTV